MKFTSYIVLGLLASMQAFAQSNELNVEVIDFGAFDEQIVKIKDQMKTVKTTFEKVEKGSAAGPSDDIQACFLDFKDAYETFKDDTINNLDLYVTGLEALKEKAKNDMDGLQKLRDQKQKEMNAFAQKTEDDKELKRKSIAKLKDQLDVAKTDGEKQRLQKLISSQEEALTMSDGIYAKEHKKLLKEANEALDNRFEKIKSDMQLGYNALYVNHIGNNVKVRSNWDYRSTSVGLARFYEGNAKLKTNELVNANEEFIKAKNDLSEKMKVTVVKPDVPSELKLPPRYYEWYEYKLNPETGLYVTDYKHVDAKKQTSVLASDARNHYGADGAVKITQAACLQWVKSMKIKETKCVKNKESGLYEAVATDGKSSVIGVNGDKFLADHYSKEVKTVLGSKEYKEYQSQYSEYDIKRIQQKQIVENAKKSADKAASKISAVEADLKKLEEYGMGSVHRYFAKCETSTCVQLIAGYVEDWLDQASDMNDPASVGDIKLSKAKRNKYAKQKRILRRVSKELSKELPAAMFSDSIKCVKIQNYLAAKAKIESEELKVSSISDDQNKVIDGKDPAKTAIPAGDGKSVH